MLQKNIPPRSVGERLNQLERRNRIPSKDKFRMMPCKSFIMCGGCPYHERCVFLHDPRIKSPFSNATPNKQAPSSSRNVKDIFYWPDMRMDKILQSMNIDHLPTAEQEYDIPEDFVTHPGMHDRALYSIWKHFTTFCNATQFQIEKESQSNYIGETGCYVDHLDYRIDRSPTAVNDAYVFGEATPHPAEHTYKSADTTRIQMKYLPNVHVPASKLPRIGEKLLCKDANVNPYLDHPRLPIFIEMANKNGIASCAFDPRVDYTLQSYQSSHCNSYSCSRGCEAWISYDYSTKGWGNQTNKIPKTCSKHSDSLQHNCNNSLTSPSARNNIDTPEVKTSNEEYISVFTPKSGTFDTGDWPMLCNPSNTVMNREDDENNIPKALDIVPNSKQLSPPISPILSSITFTSPKMDQAPFNRTPQKEAISNSLDLC